MRPARWALAALLLSSPVLAPPGILSSAPLNRLEGRPVERLELRSDVAGLKVKQIEGLLALAVGESFSESAIAKSLRNLQASGLVSEVEAYASAEAEGVVVTFVLWGRVQVTRIRFEGDLELKERELRAVLEQKVAGPLVESRIVRGIFNLEEHYHGLGYLEASVRARPRVDLEAKEAEVVFEVTPGPRFVVRSLAFDGPTGPLDEEQLVGRLRMGPGKAFRERAARADSERLELWLVSQGYRSATVGPFASEVHWDSSSVDVTYQIDVGPQFHIEIRGAEQSKLQKKGLLPFLDSQRYDEAILLQSVAKVRRYYQELGHYRAQVDWSETRGEDIVHLAVTIEPGPPFVLSEVKFAGNEALTTEQLSDLVATSPRRVLAPGSGRLVDDVVAEDISNIHSYYRLQGFWDAQVGPHEVVEDEGKLTLVIPIEEGPQRRLVSFNLDGVEAIDEAALRRSLPLRPGGPYHPILLEETLNAARAFYESKGFEAVQLAPSVDWNDEETLADLHLRVVEGPRSVIDRVVIRGNLRTRPRVIRKALNLRSGDTLSTARLLEAQKALYGLGAFSSVNVQRAPGTPFKGERDILVEVEEGNRHSITYGIGYDTEDGISGLLGYTRSNLLGKGLTGRIDLRASQRDNLARLLLFQPYLGPVRLPTTGSLFYIEETRDSFTSLRRGGQTEVKRLGGHSSTGLLFDYRLVDILELDPALDPEGIDREFQEVRIASLTPNWQLDHRNDPLDPSRGWATNLQVEYALPILGADEEFLKGFAQYTHFYDLGWLGSIGGSLRLGAIGPIDKSDQDDSVPELPGSDPIQPSAYIPISERFFAGGRSTHRAYRRDRLGICGETLVPSPKREESSLEEQCELAESLVPAGGNGLLLLNLDYRFPIAGPVGGNLFVDAGNVWGDWRSINLAEVKTGIGVGVRYLSPVGPLRLEIGWKLDRVPGEDPYVIFFSFGNPY